MIQDGGVFESLMHCILYAEDHSTILFGRPGKDAGQDARTFDGRIVYQAKYRKGIAMDGAIALALDELQTIKKYRQHTHVNHIHWQHAQHWVLFANFSINPNDNMKWREKVVPAFRAEGLEAEFKSIEDMEGKLAIHTEVRDVFFCGENRVLVGLKEAHDLLSAECVGKTSFEKTVIGRETELDKIIEFASCREKRILPVTGPGGIGKSRLLYEVLVSLGQDGWRVLWGLPGTMVKSSRWFRLLNGSQKTCVALDDPDDPNLLRVVIEQLASVERRNWIVIVSYRTEKATLFRKYRAHRLVHEPLVLNSLDEANSKKLIETCLEKKAQESWLYSVYKFTHGVPGWICLIIELANRNALNELPSSADDIASAYIDNCLGNIHREHGLTMIRWLALWGVLAVEAGNEEQQEFIFLEKQGIPKTTIHNLLSRLVETGLVRNWGMGKRIYAIEPLIVRQQILSNWLFVEDSGDFIVSENGKSLVSLLVNGEIPAQDSILNTIVHLSQSRLREQEVYLFLKPFFKAMSSFAKDGSVVDQYRVVDLVEAIGAAEPESALDVFVAVRQNTKDNMKLEIQPWGTQIFTHQALVKKLPSVMAVIATHIAHQNTAYRYIEELRSHWKLQDKRNIDGDDHKDVAQILNRMLCSSENWEIFNQPAHSITRTGLTETAICPFVMFLIECLLNPFREYTEWTASWTIVFIKSVLHPESSAWDKANKLRESVFAILRTTQTPIVRERLWKVLANSHHQYHRAIMHGNVKGDAINSYQEVLLNDLKTCYAILKSPPIELAIEEATQARDMWSWYLRFGRDGDPTELANQCEQIYDALSTWRMHDFFRFGSDEELTSETDRIVNMLKAAPDKEVFSDFFYTAKRYLNAARPGHKDMADDMRISKIADLCADLFSMDPRIYQNPLSLFVLSVMEEAEIDTMPWHFAVQVYKRHFLKIKASGSKDLIKDGLAQLLSTTKENAQLLWGLYSNAHPVTTGELTDTEMNYIYENESGFSNRKWFILCGVFLKTNKDRVLDSIRSRLDALSNDRIEASHCLQFFIESLQITALRYKWEPESIPILWLIEMITEFQLDGSLLGSHDLEWMRDKTGYRLNMIQAVSLMQSRIAIESQPKPIESVEIVPYDFKFGEWCQYNPKNRLEVDAFHEFCTLALGQSFTAVYWMPKYIAQIDPLGIGVRKFIEKYLDKNKNTDGDSLARLGYLASAYTDDTQAWSDIATPICVAAKTMSREDREHIFFGLSKKETGAIGGTPGEVAPYYIKMRDTAAHLLNGESLDSPLREYREWSYNQTVIDLRREEGRAEELANE